MKRTTRILSIILLAVAVLLATCAAAIAYPAANKWTSDVTIPGITSAKSIDIAAKGSNLHVLYTAGSPARVYYVRSLDRGATWNSPVLIDLGTEAEGDKYPAIATGAANNVYVGYVSQERTGATNFEALFRRSQNNGTTWDAGYYSFTSSPVEIRPVTYLASTRTPTDNPAFVLTHGHVTGYTFEAYWRRVQNDGTFSAEMAASEIDTSNAYRYDSYYPRIDTDGTNYFIIYAEYNGYAVGEGFHLNQIRVNRYNGSNNWDTLVWNDTSGIYLEYPDIGCEDILNHTFYASWLRRNGSGWNIRSAFWNGAWSMYQIYNGTNASPSYPKVIPLMNEGVEAYRSNDATDVLADGYIDELMMNCNPQNGDRSIATTTDGVNSDLAVAGTDGKIRVKRIDKAPPTGTLTVTGGTFGSITYVKPSFDFDFLLTDEWDVTGTDPLGDNFTRGVTSVRVERRLVGAPTWDPLGTFPNASTTDGHWLGTTSGGDWTDGQLYEMRGIATDTAGNEGTIAYATQLRVDAVYPTLSISPSADSWYQANKTVTMTSNDNRIVSYIEYKINDGAWVKINNPSPSANFVGQFTISTDSYNNITARCADAAGNVSSERYVKVHVDKTKPIVQITYPDSGGVMDAERNNFVYIKSNASDNLTLAHVTVAIDGKVIDDRSGEGLANPELMTNCWNVKDVREGSYTITLTATDAAGNVSTTSRVATLRKAGSVFGDFYFAEGTTRDGFDEYICILNPETNTANITFDFQLETGEVIRKSATVAPNSRATFNVRDMVPAGHDVSTRVHSDGALVLAERPMYFNYNGWTGGHTAIGRNAPTKTFYFAEGTTRDGFDTYLCLANFSDSTANVTATYMLGNGENKNKSYAVPAHSRRTVNVNADVGGGQDVSAKVTSDIAIAVERPMYFNYRGMTGGHLVTGATAPKATWYFAEGTTRANFDEYLCIQNPGDSDANVTVTYRTATGGYGDKIEKKVKVPKRSRFTVDVRKQAGDNLDLAATVTSDVGIIVERPMYFSYNGMTGGSDVLGANDEGHCYWFAEGTTREGFNEWLTIYTPSTGSNRLLVTYLFADGTKETREYEARYRLTIDVNAEVGPNRDVSIIIENDPKVGNKFIVERPMYFNYKGWTGGHCAGGYGVY